MITQASFWILLSGSVVVFWLLPRGREWFLVAVSLAYLAYLDLGAAMIAVYWPAACWWAGRPRHGRRASSTHAFAAIAGLLLCLAYYKYLPPILYDASGGARGKPAASVVVPLGLSYLTFKLVAYLLDAVRGVVPAGETQGASLRRFALWTSFFPIFSAGPIERYEPFSRNDPKAFELRTFGKGLTRIIYGLVKKLVLVDVLMSRKGHSGYDFHLWTPPSLEWILAHIGKASTLSVWQFAANRNLSAYLDFSAYSDIAIGGALLFGYEVGENFDYPVLATNIGDYWKRWHMSLSAWCQRYVYMPVVGKTRSPYIAVFVTMFVMGVWHSASLNMVAWGLYHAVIIRIYLTWGRIKRRKGWRFDHPAAGVLGWALTTVAVFGAASFSSTTAHGIGAGVQIFLKLLGITWHRAAG